MVGGGHVTEDRHKVADIIGIDHIYIAVSDLARSERFYDKVLLDTLGFRRNRFELNGDPHIHYFNRHFGYVIRPAQIKDAQSRGLPGLHHLCFRVETIAEVEMAARQLRALGIDASEAQLFVEYAPDYWATFFTDPDGVRLEITNYRRERRERNENWESPG